ncbi:MAG TPA: helix-turn-helix transcriptional regulator [Jatrophihabitans sp.]|jgi:DNA-binding NarL/FixJ family response regulator|nr:helix-turn-helix transcriptional regulator [Jatrophihabitans sp.]
MTTSVLAPWKPDEGTLTSLTHREQEVLRLMAEGLSNVGIGARMYLSARTVEVHIGSIFDKLGLISEPAGNRRVQAVIRVLGVTSDH